MSEQAFCVRAHACEQTGPPRIDPALFSLLIVLTAHAAAFASDQPYHRLPSAVSGDNYQYSIPVVGGMPPLTWSWSGDTPPGLELRENGAIIGITATPRSVPYRFFVEVADSSDPPMRYSIAYELTVQAQQLRILPPGSSSLEILPPKEEAVESAPPPGPPTPRPTSLSAPSAMPAAAVGGAGTVQSLKPVVKDFEATSLYRPSEDLVVKTNILLLVEGSSTRQVRFRITSFPTRGLVKDSMGNILDSSVTLKAMSGQKSAYAIYEPNAGETGEDSFRYVAEVDGVPSNEATVSIKIEKAGLKWELVTAGASGLSSDPGENDGGVAGKTKPDFLFRLDWNIQKPNKKKKPSGGSIVATDAATGRLYLDPSADNGKQSNAHAQFRIGVVTRPITVMASEADPGGADMMMTTTLTYQRAFTAGAEFNYNYVNGADNQGTFFELGGLVRFDLDAFIDDDEIMERDGGTFIRLRRREDRRGFYRFETGARFALKQLAEGVSEDPNTLMIGNKGNTVLFPRNLVDLLTVEAVYQNNEALRGLIPATPGETVNRFAFRFFGMPPVPNTPGAFFLIGVEVSKDFHGGPQDLRLFYGLNAALDRFF